MVLFLLCESDSLLFNLVRYLSVSLSPTLNRNEKVEQYIRKKTHKPTALRFWIEGGVILLYGLAQFSFLFVSSVFTPSNYPTNLIYNFFLEYIFPRIYFLINYNDKGLIPI